MLEEIGRNLTPSPFLISAVAFVEALKGTRAARALVSRHPRRRHGRARWRSTKGPSTGPRRSRCAPSGRATASA